MSEILKPLSLLASRRQAVVAATSLTGSTVRKHSETGDAGTGDSVNFLETKYGIRLDVTDAKQGVLKIRDISPRSQQQQSVRLHYRLFPDWQTSFLWDAKSKRAVEDDEEDDDGISDEVDNEVIQARYPSLWPYYAAWRQAYETAFEKQGCHLGSGAEVFPDAADRISWDVEGLLMAAWLAMREDVESVEYGPRSKQSCIEKATIDKDLADFLRGVWDEEAFVEFK